MTKATRMPGDSTREPVANGRVFRPEKVVLAREALGWNQSELATAIGVTQATISKIENGIAAVRPEEIRHISKALGFTEDLFTDPTGISGLESSYLFHRKRLTTPIGVQKRIQANVNILHFQIKRLLQGVDLEFDKKFDVIDLDRDNSESTPKQIAQMVRAAWRVPIGPIRNLTELIESAGGIVLKCDFDTPRIDAVHLRPIGLPPLFFLNRELSGDRLRWTLAHELGHAFLHTNNISPDIEDEADEFAGEFLMPEREVVHQLYEMNLERAAALKAVWRVSMASLIRQAYNHKCITKWKYRSLCILLSKSGYRKVEPFPLPIEEPALLKSVIATYRFQLGYDPFDLARLLYMNHPDFFEDCTKPRLMRIDGKPFFAFAAA